MLGQLKVADKSNEITAIPALLEALAIEGCLVSIDAMGTQREIARAIRAGDGDKVQALLQAEPKLAEARTDDGSTALHLAALDLVAAEKTEVEALRRGGAHLEHEVGIAGPVWG